MWFVLSLAPPSLPSLSLSSRAVAGFQSALWKQIWFPCMATEPIEIVTVNIGPETGLGGGTHDTEFYAPTPLNMGLFILPLVFHSPYEDSQCQNSNC